MWRLVKSLIVVALLAAVVAGGLLAHFALTPIEFSSAPLELQVKPGSALRSVSRQIAEAGAGFAPWQFTLLGRIAGDAARIKAGSYELQQGITPWQLLSKLSAGEVSLAEIAFIEGWTFRQMRTALDAHPALRHDTQGLNEGEILSRIGASEAAAEGVFFPDTYLFDKNSSDVDVLRRAHRSMRRIVDREWAARDGALPYATPYQALIMASIVEKETGAGAERPLVAAVFTNRLRQGMPLQTDPTVIYGIGPGFDGNLRKRDLQRDTAYNTYTRAGLPPTPIAMPGLASIQAVMRPASSDMLYFVARGDGTSEFSRTLDEHNRAVVRYQKRGGG